MRDAEAGALTDGEACSAGMGTETLAVEINDVAGLEGGGVGSASSEKRAVIVVGDETNFLTFWLSGDGEAEFFSEATDVRFRQRAEREKDVPELGLRETVEKIGLIFARIGSSAEMEEVIRTMFNTCVVACGEKIAALGARVVKEYAELEELVTAHAGIGGATAEIFATEISDDEIFEMLSEGDDSVGNFKKLRDALGIGDMFATCAGGMRGGIGGEIEGHGDAKHGVALVKEEGSGDGGIDTATHGDHDARRGRASHGR